jgi:uroporphyrin-3 C-methyltransferase
VALGVAIAVAGFVWVEQRTGVGPRVAALAADVDARSSELAALAARLDDYAATRRRVDDDLERLQERVARDTDALATLPDRLSTLEENVDRFAGAGDRVRAAWLVAEAEHYLRMGNAQLGLAGDVRVAQTSLELADDTLRELGDPRFTPVRKQLAAELVALKAVPQPDTEGIVLTLGTLGDSLETLPLKQSAPDAFRRPATVVAEPVGPLARAWAAVQSAASRLVSIRRVDQPVTPLLTDAERSVLVRSLDLELQLARLAVMRGDVGMYRRSVEAATARVEQHFDASSPEVQVAIDTLRQLGGIALPEELPDISGSLTALLKATGAATP